MVGHLDDGVPLFPVSTSTHWRCAPRPKWDSQPPSSGSTVEDSWAERVFLPAWTSSARTSGIPCDAIGSTYPASPPRARCASRTTGSGSSSTSEWNRRCDAVGDCAPGTRPVVCAETSSRPPQRTAICTSARSVEQNPKARDALSGSNAGTPSTD